jgi:hypothetical protein
VVELHDSENTEKRATVASAKLERLRHLLESDEYTALQGLYREGAGTDAGELAVTSHCSGGTRKVIRLSGAETPPVLEDVMRELDSLVGQLG